jgi:D-glycero-alpha-D-manno-heptose-7-phosphate kinase
MIISKTPFRISFFGGGTDYPDWYLKNGGQVLSTTIDKYCYITLRYLPPFFEHRMRVVYSKIENIKKIDKIKHPAVRETLRFMEFDNGLEIHHDGDLPARSGMGSSSSFTVGLLHSLYALKGIMCNKMQLAMESIHIEQNMIKETVGSQDQVAAAFGGFNHIIFKDGTGEIEVRPIILKRHKFQELNNHLMLFYTGIMRTASDVAKSYVVNIESKKKLLIRLHDMVNEGIEILKSEKCICRFGELMHEAWKIKRGFSSEITNSVVEDLFERAYKRGAIGGKLTGAGGGGFLLLFVPPSEQRKVREELKELLHIPFRFDFNGSQIIFYDPKIDDFSHIKDERTLKTIKCFRELDSLVN